MFNVKLGKLPAVHDPRTLKMARYLTPGLPPPPSICDWSNNISAWDAMLNDQIGDCAIAAPGHMIMVWTGLNGVLKRIPDSDILTAYSAISGYNPRTGKNDNGCNMLQVLQYWQQTGIGGDKIQAYGTINYQDEQAVKQAVYLFGGCYIGVQLPISAQGQSTWDVIAPLHGSGAPGSWGGHAIPIIAYDDQYYVVSWGSLIPMTKAFYETYCDETYAALSNDWLSSGKVAPNSFDLSMLTADLSAIQSA